MKGESFNLDFEEILIQSLLVLTVLGFFFSLYYTSINLILPKNVNIVFIIPFVFFLTPYLIMKLYRVKKVEAKMQVIPRFLRDVVDNVESGMDLISSIKHTIGNEYSVLNEEIKKFVNQLSWNVDFEIALLNFAKNIGSRSLERDFLLVVEARKVGGHVEKILRELSEKINTENLRTRERKSNLASNTFTGYISFIIFIFIIVLTFNNLFLGLGNAMNEQSNAAEIPQQQGDLSDVRLNVFLTLLILLSYELAILSGFLFGLMQENNIIAGAPHVVVLVMITFSAFFFFIDLI
ncbi:MAG: type II secretion system F family protein [Nanoarchaeota archaeon]|nr:type II secretion system F family protein [Nanoarchaeota archaeon]